MKRNRILQLGLMLGLIISLMFVGSCVPAEGTEQQGGTSSTIYMIVFLVLIFGMMYFLMIRPQQKRQREHQQLTAQLRKGEKVITAGGMYGEIERVDEDSVVLKVESGATIRVTKGSIVARRER